MIPTLVSHAIASMPASPAKAGIQRFRSRSQAASPLDSRLHGNDGFRGLGRRKVTATFQPSISQHDGTTQSAATRMPRENDHV